MPFCTHKGCEKSYIEEKNNDQACLYHPMAPIFHEGLKGWQCCNKRVTTFDEFLAIPGCTKGRHTDEVPPPPESDTTITEQDIASSKAPTIDENGVEIYNHGPTYPQSNQPIVPSQMIKSAQKVEKEPEEDDPTIPVAPGTICKRPACNTPYVDNATSRGEGPQANCVHHPGDPIFHEGSKGWSCCSRKVLEFDEFLKIKGCKTGNHLFIGSGKKENVEEIIQCRHDWYQTPSQIIMSVFCKKINKENSTIGFKEKELCVDLMTTDGKRFKETYPLYQCINSENSTYEFLSTKIEIKLKKASGTSWPSLRSDENTLGATTFGVKGSATVGGKEYSLATDLPLYSNQQ